MLILALLLANIGIAAFALRRLWPGTCIIAINEAVALRGLSRVERIGRPHAQSFVPDAVFSSSNVATATNIFLIATVMLAASLLWRSRGGNAGRVTVNLPALPRWMLWLFCGYYLASILSSGTILQGGYANDAWTILGVNLGGLNALIHSLVTYEIIRRVSDDGLRPSLALGVIVGLFFLTDYSKGSTGLATGYIVTSAVILAGFEPRPLVRWSTLLISLGTVVLAAYVVRGVRPVLHEQGLDAVADQTASTLRSFTQTISEDDSDGDNGNQYAAHMLECVSLYDSGISRNWRSMSDAIIFTFEPSFLLEPLGITRPTETAWELRDYFVHTGGTFVLGELYWNGGYLCVFVMFALILIWARFCDTHYRSSLAGLVGRVLVRARSSPRVWLWLNADRSRLRQRSDSHHRPHDARDAAAKTPDANEAKDAHRTHPQSLREAVELSTRQMFKELFRCCGARDLCSMGAQRWKRLRLSRVASAPW